MRLGTKLSLALSGLSIGVMSVALLFLYFMEERSLYRRIESEQAAAVLQLAAMFAQTPLRDETGRLELTREFLLDAEGIVRSIALLDADGRVLLHSDFLRGDRSQSGSKLEEPVMAEAFRTGGLLRKQVDIGSGRSWRLSCPVPALDRRWTLVTLYHLDAIRLLVGGLQKALLVRFLQVMLLGVSASILFASILSRRLTRPVLALAAGAVRIGEGDFDHRIEPGGRDELGQLARSFNRMAESLAEAEELKAMFVDGVTHDLRGPLGVIQGYVELEKERRPGEDGAPGALPIIDEQIRRLKLYVSNLLDASKLRHGDIPLSLEDLDAAGLLGQARQAFSLIARLREIDLSCEAEPGLPPCRADRELLARVLANLLTNAFKFTPKGGKVSLRAARDGSDCLRLTVSDTGPGIPAADLPRLFERFVQVEKNKRLAREPGTGLGLAICRQFVELHGGRIWAESREGEGSAFHLTLPLAGPAVQEGSKKRKPLPGTV